MKAAEPSPKYEATENLPEICFETLSQDQISPEDFEGVECKLERLEIKPRQPGKRQISSANRADGKKQQEL